MTDRDKGLGRQVDSSRDASRCQSNNYPRKYKFFIEAGDNKVSVDRLYVACASETARLAEHHHATRVERRSFYGWLAITREAAMQSGRYLELSPTCDNPYHVEIVLPAEVLEDSRVYQDHAVEMTADVWWWPAE